MKLKTLLAATLFSIGSLIVVPHADAMVLINYNTNNNSQIIFDDQSIAYETKGDLTRGAVWTYENGTAKIVNFHYFKNSNTLRVRVENGEWKYVNRYTDDDSLEFKYGSLIALKLAEKRIIPVGIQLDKFYNYKNK